MVSHLPADKQRLPLIENIIGSSGNDTLIGNIADNSIRGGDGDDVIYLNGALYDGNDTDTVDAGGNDTVHGEGGNDTIHGTSRDQITVGGGIGDFFGGPGDDVMYGNDGADSMDGQEGNDSVSGGPGPDYLITTAGNDTLDGGEGNDWLESQNDDGTVYVFGADYGHDVLATMFQHEPETGIRGSFRIRPYDEVLFTGLSSGELELEWEFEEAPPDIGYIQRHGQAALRIAGTEDTLYLGYLVWTKFPLIGEEGIYYWGLGSISHAEDGSIIFDGTEEPWSLFESDHDFNWMRFDDGSTYSLDDLFDLETVSRTTLPASYTSALDDFNAARAGGGTGGPDALTGSSAANALSGLAGNDTLSGLGGDDTLDGGAGNDALLGGPGNDTLDGGLGTDTADYSTAAAGVTVDLAAGAAPNDGDGGTDSITGVEAVISTGFNDSLAGDAGDNVLSGQGGNDTLTGGAGADTLDGGAGIDLAAYASSAAAVSVNLLTLTASGGDAQGDSLAGIENLSGSAFNDTLAGDGAANRLDGLAGDDSLAGGEGIDTVVGGDGNDVIEGGLGADSIDGGAGVDMASWQNAAAAISVDLTAGTSSEGDTLAAIENLRGTALSDTLDAGTVGGAANLLDGLAGNDTLRGQGGNDTLLGGDGADSLSGGGDDDVIEGGLGADLIDGGAGTDIASWESAAAAVSANLGTASSSEGDTLTSIENLRGSAFADTLDAGSGGLAANRLEGLAGNDTLRGQNGNDTLIGGDGNDSLLGGFENDLIEGGAGADTIDGGFNADTASWENAAAAVSVSLVSLTSSEGDTLVAVEYLRGSAFADTLTGDGFDNRLEGQAGDDTIVGNAGVDTLIGGAGADTLSGGTFNDLLEGGAGADSIDGGSGTDTASYAAALAAVAASLLTLTGTAGEAQGDAFSSIENLRGSAFGDTLAGDAMANLIEGLDGADSLAGDAGNDTLDGGLGADTLDGGAGTDMATAESAAAAVNWDLATGVAPDGDTWLSIEQLRGSASADTLSGDAGADRLEGMNGDDALLGRDGADTLVGGSGNDTVDGGTGADSLDGGFDTDTATWENAAAAVSVNLATGTGSDGDTLTSIENLRGSAFTDTLTGGTSNNLLEGLAGDDSLSGGGGNDTLTGGVGADTLDGGANVDMAVYANSSAAVTIDLAAASASGGDAQGDALTGIEQLRGSSFADSLSGDANANRLEGLAGNDSLVAGSGSDSLYGGDGDDLLDAGIGADYIEGNAGGDTLSYEYAAAGVTVNLTTGTSSEGDTILGAENLVGSAFNDTLTTGGLSGLLDGKAGADSLAGSWGNDTLIGGAGADTLLGSLGNDSYRFTDLSSVDYIGYAFESAGVTGGDVIELSSAVFAALAVGALAANAFLNSTIDVTAASAASTADHRIIYDRTDGELYYDADGVGGADAVQFARIVSTLTPSPVAITGLNLAAVDFMVI